MAHSFFFITASNDLVHPLTICTYHQTRMPNDRPDNCVVRHWLYPLQFRAAKKPWRRSVVLLFDHLIFCSVINSLGHPGQWSDGGSESSSRIEHDALINIKDINHGQVNIDYPPAFTTHHSIYEEELTNFVSEQHPPALWWGCDVQVDGGPLNSQSLRDGEVDDHVMDHWRWWWQRWRMIMETVDAQISGDSIRHAKIIGTS